MMASEKPCSGPAHWGFGFQALEATIVHQYHHLKKVRLDAGGYRFLPGNDPYIFFPAPDLSQLLAGEESL